MITKNSVGGREVEGQELKQERQRYRNLETEGPIEEWMKQKEFPE